MRIVPAEQNLRCSAQRERHAILFFLLRDKPPNGHRDGARGIHAAIVKRGEGREKAVLTERNVMCQRSADGRSVAIAGNIDRCAVPALERLGAECALPERYIAIQAERTKAGSPR